MNLIGLSAIPAIPVLLLGYSTLDVGMFNDNFRGYQALAILLGTLGVAGLIMASISSISRSEKMRQLIILLIFLGFMAVIMMFSSALLLSKERDSVYIPLILILFLLSWPICSGIVVIKELRSKNA
ncbi:MAG: hypothetical protein KME69_18870 [Candidatus Thiodiazotropha sp. (ex Codakia orbicularis)]|nr:hypothetical protein [Candidatus Thiodiazotropha sp. (ex Codakia orbicularis)]